jgi:hypothetical protein
MIRALGLLAAAGLFLAPTMSDASIRRGKDGKNHPITAPGKFQPRYKGVKLGDKRIGLPLKKQPQKKAQKQPRFTAEQIKTIEDAAVAYAAKQIGGDPVFIGNVNGDLRRLKTFTQKGVIVSTGDENDKVQFGVWRVRINKAGEPTSLQQL